MIGKRLDCHPEISVAGYAMRWNAGPTLHFRGLLYLSPKKNKHHKNRKVTIISKPSLNPPPQTTWMFPRQEAVPNSPNQTAATSFWSSLDLMMEQFASYEGVSSQSYTWNRNPYTFLTTGLVCGVKAFMDLLLMGVYRGRSAKVASIWFVG